MLPCSMVRARPTGLIFLDQVSVFGRLRSFHAVLNVSGVAWSSGAEGVGASCCCACGIVAFRLSAKDECGLGVCILGCGCGTPYLAVGRATVPFGRLASGSLSQLSTPTLDKTRPPWASCDEFSSSLEGGWGGDVILVFKLLLLRVEIGCFAAEIDLKVSLGFEFL